MLKGSSAGQAIHINKEQRGGTGGMGNYTVYVNPYLVLKSGSYTKHYYIEGQRITSKLGAGWDIKTNVKAGGDKVDFAGKKQRLQEGLVKNLRFLGADGTILTAGRSGKVPPGQLNGTATGTAETFQYFFHPDHLGSTSYIPDASGEVYQHLEYIAFGETFVEEHSNTDRTPYLFNGKELDEETGLYYYGARYYDPRTSIWQSVDPLAEKMPAWSAYNYSFNNPIRFIDPDGMAPGDGILGKLWNSVRGHGWREGNFEGLGDYKSSPMPSATLDEVVVVGHAEPAVLTSNANEFSVAGYSGEGSASWVDLSAKGSITGFAAEAKNHSGNGTIEVGAKATALEVSGSLTKTLTNGSEENNFQVSAQGNAFVAEGNFGAGVLTGQNGKTGFFVGGEASAAALKGEINPSVSILGVKIGVTIGGSIGSAQIGAGIGAYHDNKNGTAVMKASVTGGVLGAFKLGVQFETKID